jgi:hypothetical protein
LFVHVFCLFVLDLADKTFRDTLLKTVEVSEDWEMAMIVGCRVSKPLVF